MEGNKYKYKRCLLSILFLSLFIMLIPEMKSIQGTINELNDELARNGHLSDSELLILKNQHILFASFVFMDIFFGLITLKYAYNFLINFSIFKREIYEEENLNEEVLDEEESSEE